MLRSAGILVALLAPSLVFAAYNDVSLTTDTVLSVNGVTLNVSGSTAAVESITVNATDFSVTLPVGSTFEVTAPGLEQLQADTGSGLATDICNASQSVVKYEPTAAAVTVTISPSATVLCSSSGSGGSAPVSSPEPSPAPVSSGGGGGGGGSIVTTPVTQANETPAETPAVSASGLSSEQINSILNVLASFNADADVIAKVRAALEGTITGSVTSAAVHVFKSDLQLGSLGEEVKTLQEYLNAHGYNVAASGPGSPGNETTKFGSLTKAAIIGFQKAHNITPAVGYFGPLTRAAVNANP